MNHKEWEAVEKARDILQLGDKATLGEIKRAYHRLSKQHHPDATRKEGDRHDEHMYRITAAYDLLMRYCAEYKFPLTVDDDNIYDAEDWWMERFGSDPLWGKATKRR